jgi:hypothetical protein
MSERETAPGELYRSAKERAKSGGVITWAPTVGTLVMAATFLVQGGRVLESLDTIKAEQMRVNTQANSMQSEIGNLKLEVSNMRGADQLHVEQINNIRWRIDQIARPR